MKIKLSKEEEKKGKKEYKLLLQKIWFQKMGIDPKSVEWLDDFTFIYKGNLICNF
jgi:hypothetical protein